MYIKVKNFDELVKQEWNYPRIGSGTKDGTQLHLHSQDMDISGGHITKQEIDVLADYSEIKSVTISGLNQETFEYFIKTYGRQLRFIEFFKNKAVEDWSLLGLLPELEGIHWFWNQRITSLWDMSGNVNLRAVALEDFSRLRHLSGVEKAPALEWFYIGDAVWNKNDISSLKPFVNSTVRRLGFGGKKIIDENVSCLKDMKTLEVLDFAPNQFSTEQVAFIVANRPDITGRSLQPYIEFMRWNEETWKSDIPAVCIVGKRKPILDVAGNEKRITNYVMKFDELVQQYRQYESE